MVADFNDDGNLDIIVAVQPEQGLPNTNLFVGNGYGEFLPGGQIQTGPLPNLAVMVGGDFNGDGFADFAIAPGGKVFLGLGDGGFDNGPGTQSLVAVVPSALAAADFLHSGNAVLAGIVGGSPCGVSFWNPDGGAPIIATTTAPCAENSLVPVLVGDFNGDGWADIAIATPTSTGYAVGVLLNTTDGGFGPPTYNEVQGTLLGAGDFNGDGLTDLVDANQGVGLSRPDGGVTFIGPSLSPLPSGEAFTIVADLNLDGNLDAIVPGSIWLGNGRGALAQLTTDLTIMPPEQPWGWGTTADFNNDGYPDLLVAPGWDGAFNPIVMVAMGRGDGTFPHPLLDTAPGAGSNLATADFNGDGVPDLAVAGSSGLGIYLGVGDGSFVDGGVYLGGSWADLRVIDFDQDGVPDVAVLGQGVNFGLLSLLHGEGNGAFADAGTLGGAGGEALVSGRFDGSENLDLVVLDQSTQSIAIFAGDGHGGFHWSSTVNLDGGTQGSIIAAPPAGLDAEAGVAVAGDWNSDCLSDLAVLGESALFLLLNGGDGGFSVSYALPLAGAPVAMSAGRVNSTATLDLVVLSEQPQTATETMTMILGQADGGLTVTGTNALPFLSPRSFAGMVVVDANGDGVPDIFVNGQFGTLLLGEGDGGFLPRTYVSATGSDGPVLSVDLNGDGVPDFVSVDEAYSQASPHIESWMNACLQ